MELSESESQLFYFDDGFYAIINFAHLLQAKPFQFMLGTGMAIEVIVKERVRIEYILGALQN